MSNIKQFRYTIIVHESGHKIPVAQLDSLFLAKKLAEKYVDDALPNNTVHVFDGDKDIGYAALAGDGGKYWKDAK